MKNYTRNLIGASALALCSLVGSSEVKAQSNYGYNTPYEEQEKSMGYGTMIAGGAALALLTTAAVSGARVVRPDRKGIVERFGKYRRTADAGLTFTAPFGIDKMYKVPISEIRVDVPAQQVITKDKLNATVDGIVYYKVQDPVKALYNVNDYSRAIPSLAQTTLRAVIGQMSLAEANEKRQELNSLLEREMDKQILEWGIDVMRVELMSIEPPKHVQEAMNEVVVAENRKIAAVDTATALETEADGKRRAAIKEAEGSARSVELAAEAAAKSIILRADAQAKSIQMVGESTELYFGPKAQAYRQLEVAERVFEEGTKLIIPQGTPLVNMLGDLAGVKG